MNNVIYLAAGCVWGAEKAFKSLNGVNETTVGYANGNGADVNYQEVKTGLTGYKETVRVVYDPEVISLNKILKAYFICIDPTLENQQGEDIGSQYQTGVYYVDDDSKEICEKYFAKVKDDYPSFKVQLTSLKNFVEGEEYHQDYLEKNPSGYCHINLDQFEQVKALNNEYKISSMVSILLFIKVIAFKYQKDL